MKKKIIIICGFLGSGKTTLLGHLLGKYGQYKLGVLLNDFGEIPVDGTLIENSVIPGEAVLEIGGGSIFCACLKDSLVKALIQLAKSPAELVFVEASGMADPAGLKRILNDAHLESDFEHLCTICAFDPIKSWKLSHVLEVIPRQINASDIVLMTKGDMTSDQEKNRAKAYIKSVNKDIFVTEKISDIKILSMGREHCDRIFFSSMNTQANRPDSFSISRTDLHLEQFLTLLEQTREILRVKGYITCQNQPYYISDTGKGFEVNACDQAITPLTVICMQGTLNNVKKRFFDQIQP